MKRPVRPVLPWMARLALAGVLAGCGGASASASAETTPARTGSGGAGEAVSKTRVLVETSADTNEGKSMYMMIRSVEEGILTNESYQDAAARLFATPADATILESQPLFPGKSAEATVSGEAKKDVVIYFFFTKPDGDWRVHLARPLPAEVVIELGEQGICNVEKRRR